MTTAAVVVRPLSATQAATRNRLLAAARELAADGGYEAVGMRQVAARAGLSAPTAYLYFSSKDHVLVDLLVDLVGHTTTALSSRPGRSRVPVERAVAMLRRSVENVEKTPKLYVAMTRAYISGSPEVAHARVALESSMRQWIDLALADAKIVDRDIVVRILEAVLFANMVGLVTGGRAPGEIADELERARANDLEATVTDEPLPPAHTTKIRDFAGETPLQVMAQLGDYPTTTMTTRERFPYYTSFPFAWYRACDTTDIAPGAVRPMRLLARDLVVWRDEQGHPRVMDAYCPHLGANIGLGGRVENGHLVCPFHWWEYDGDGRNARIPYSDRTNAKARLRSYPARDVNGFLMFWYHPDPGQAPLWEIPDLPEYATDAWTEPIVADWNVRCPWQELAENGPDFVHLKTVHGAATVPEVESITYDGWFSQLRARVDFATPRGPQPGRIDTDSWGPGFSVARFSGIIDTVFLGTTTPIDWEWTQSIKAYRVKKLGEDADALDRTQRVGEALVRDLRKQMAEDNVIFDNKIHIAHPALADGDGPIIAFRRWAAQFYASV